MKPKKIYESYADEQEAYFYDVWKDGYGFVTYTKRGIYKNTDYKEITKEEFEEKKRNNELVRRALP